MTRFIQDGATPGTPSRRRPASPTPTSRRTSRRSTSGTATTTTRTATSPSPTATSTTSRRYTPARARRPAPRSWAIWSHRWSVNQARGTAARLEPQRRRPGRQHRLLDPRLHHRAGERWSRRLRPRVRPRPRSAGPLRHQRRRERHRLLDADELRFLAGPRSGHDRHDAQPHGRVGEAAARLARLRRRRTTEDGPRCSARRCTRPRSTQALIVTLPKDANGKDRFYIAENRQYAGLRLDAAEGPYNFGWTRDEAELGRALPLPERPADQLLEHRGVEQQHQDAPGHRPDPAGRRPTEVR